jgi:stage II sporulation protein D
MLASALPASVSGPARRIFAITDEEIDAVLQRAAATALGGREGAVLVLDARTGHLRAVVNSRLSFEEATPPGSTIKVFTELTALRDSLIDRDSRALCRGRYVGHGLKFNCSHPPRQPAFTPVQALAYSCNNYFGKIGERLDGEHFKRTLKAFGFGSPTGAGDREANGALPRDSVDVAAALGESPELLVTPIQLITAYTALVNGGRLLNPHLSVGRQAEVRELLQIAPEHRSLLLGGMRGATTFGTAARAGLATLPIHVFGKTGTSTPLDDFRPQGWFVGFAADRVREGVPEAESIGLSVLVMLKRSHGSDSAVAARAIFEAYARLLERNRSDEPDQAPTHKRESEITSPLVESETPNSTPYVTLRLSREDATLRLSLDDYVFGVLAAEGSVEDELEAHKAQAVVSRTFALKNLRRHSRDGYDLCNSTHCQRYMAVTDEGRRPEFYALVRRAIAETSGEVLRDGDGRLAEAYFSASCGGATADIGSLWQVAFAPAYLRGRRDEFCAGTPHSKWTDVISREELLRAFRSDPRSDVGSTLDRVSVLRRDRSGRAESVLLAGQRQRRIGGWDLKIIVGRELGWKTLKSSRFDVSRSGNNFIFRGSGFGHGLGLCQSGAHVLARRGVDYRQILTEYFPGTNVRAAESPGPPITETRGVSSLRAESTGTVSSTFKLGFVATSLIPTLRAISNIKFGNPTRRRFTTAYSSRRTMSSEHFRISFPARLARVEVDAALRTLESARADLLRRLQSASIDASPLNVTNELFVHDTTGDFTGATGQPAWVAATTRSGRIESQPIDMLRRRRVLESTLRHEFVHVAAESLSRGRAPRWLVEGLAIHVAGEGRWIGRYRGKRKLTSDEIERLLERPSSDQELRELYAAAYDEVVALIRKEGESVVWRRLAQM